MGSVYEQVVFTNLANAPCRLTGGARFEFVGADGVTAVGLPANPTGGHGLLDSGQTIRATMQAGQTDNYDADRCRPVPVSGVRVVPPADSAPVVLRPLISTACSVGGQLSVQQVSNGQGRSDGGPGEGEGPG